MEKIVICADVIAEFQGKLVLVQRLDTPAGLALPGGKQDPGEFLSETARREMLEETGLKFEIEKVLGTFADPGRDPRGRRISTVFTGRATGTPKDEPQKTKVVFWEIEKLPDIKDQLLFDHREVLDRYLNTKKN